MVPTLIEDLAAYVPTLVARRLVADPRPVAAPGGERFSAAVLFVDISGFTALTERLSRRGPSGAEELTRLLNAYFGKLIEVVTAHGGDVVKFAGDGLLACWPASDEGLATAALRAVQCGFSIQISMAPGAWIEGEDERAVNEPLKVRIGIGAGEVTIAHLGGVFGRWEIVVAGDPLAQTGRAQQHGRPGDVVIAPEAWALVHQGCYGEPAESGNGSSAEAGYVRLTALRDLLPLRPLALPDLLHRAEPALRPYVPRAILVRITAGHTGWLAELRRATVLFVNLPDLGADFSLELAQKVMSALQHALYRYEGSISRLGADEKGPTLMAALGLPPFAHEDDPERGVQAALAIHAVLQGLGVRCSIGVTTGLAFCGVVGSQSRREYTMMGTTVNLAARLMQAAGRIAAEQAELHPVPILCDAATYRATQDRLSFVRLAPIMVKGWAEPVAVFTPIGLRQQEHRAHTTIVGREQERMQLAGPLHGLLQAREGCVVVIAGDAGIGKSRLLDELAHQAELSALPVLMACGIATERMAPYHAWRNPFAQLLGLDGTEEQQERQRLALERLERLAPARLPLAALLNSTLTLDLPDTEQTREMSSKLRALHTRDLLVELLRSVVHPDGDPQRFGRPLVLVVEDAHWLDSASWGLVLAIAQAIRSPDQAGLPIVMVLAIRPNEESLPGEYHQLIEVAGQYLTLEGLPPDEIRTLISRRLGVHDVPDAVQELVYRRAQGNPFFSEELVVALREHGMIVVTNGICHLLTDDLNSIALPDTVQGVITSRLDRLMPAQQMTLKVASVIGSTFSLQILEAVYPVEDERTFVRSYLATLEMAGLVVTQGSGPQPLYTFRQAVIRDVTYNLMIFAQRRQLHRRVAEWYEQHYPETARAPFAIVLAEHWLGAGEPVQALDYLDQAAAQALLSGLYHEAADVLRRALTIEQTISRQTTPERLRRARWERQLGEACYSMGRLVESREHIERALALFDRPLPASPRALCTGLLRQGLRQALHRLARPAGTPGLLVALDEEPPPEQLLEAARAYELIGTLAYYNNQLLPTLYAALRGVNLAERAGPSAELARAYATMQVVSGATALPWLARSYGRAAEMTARRTGQLQALTQVLQASGMDLLGRGAWYQAEQALDMAVALAERTGDHRRCAESRALRAFAAGMQGQIAITLQLCSTIAATARQQDDVQAQTWGLLGQAEALLALGQSVQALTLLSEAEALLTVNLDRARTEEIWAYALLALTGQRQGNRALMQHAAATASALMDEAAPFAIYALSGYAGVAEVYLSLWESHTFADIAERRRIVGGATRACAALRRLAFSVAVIRPRFHLWEGTRLWLEGHQTAALRSWERGFHVAGHLRMVYDRGRLALALAHHLTGPPRRSYLALARSCFNHTGALYYLEQVEMLVG